jgi:hypothetical protein
MYSLTKKVSESIKFLMHLTLVQALAFLVSLTCTFELLISTLLQINQKLFIIKKNYHGKESKRTGSTIRNSITC